MDDWVLVQRKSKMDALYSEIEKGISHFFTGLFYSYVLLRNHPFIQSSRGR
jgi:hypothetical protein